MSVKCHIVLLLLDLRHLVGREVWRWSSKGTSIVSESGKLTEVGSGIISSML